MRGVMDVWDADFPLGASVVILVASAADTILGADVVKTVVAGSIVK